eukprot:5183895-Amphidinium_carterae.1
MIGLMGPLGSGRPETLLLIQLRQGQGPRLPGPGPLGKSDWKSIALKYLEGRHIILHSDSAKAYDMPIDDVVRDRMVHQKRERAVADAQIHSFA